ncbi:MAG TPA: tol-pal system protein YbgF [Bryobacteraceae bacterium]|jgi:tol-pal system protein YbgF
MFHRLCAVVLLAAPATFAADKAVLELQRDVASLQDMVRQMQQQQGQQLTEIKVIAQQALDAATKANTNVAVIQSNLADSLRQQQEKVVAPVVGFGARMDGMSNDLRTTTQAVTDLASIVQKLQTQVADLATLVKAMSAPPAPPPAQVPTGGAPGQADTPSMPAGTLYDRSLGDMRSGKLDLATQEFSDYLRWYGNTDYAPNAQFYLGYIHYSQKDYEKALNEFDMVLEKYPENPKTADAMLYKGKALVALDRRKDGSQEFQEIVKRYPNTDQSRLACDGLKSLGLNCTPPKTAPGKGTTANRRSSKK